MADAFPASTAVAIIGAGPSGTAMAAMLQSAGIECALIEAQTFPRFSIGESLLPEALNCLDAAGLLDAVEAAGFQYKDGALFATNADRFAFDFGDGYTPGRGHAFQVPRAEFDLLLANVCASRGVPISYATRVQDVETRARGYRLQLEGESGPGTLDAGYIVDASGFGRVLARLFGLDKPSGIAERASLFRHLDLAPETGMPDRNKILIAQEGLDASIWYWLIPFAGQRCSVGVVTDKLPAGVAPEFLEKEFNRLLGRQDLVSAITAGAEPARPLGCLRGYSASISRLYGDNYVILGNAGEFIDPIFSSGVTIALKSAVMSAPLVVDSVRNGRRVDWESGFQAPLLAGVDTFKEYVSAWYRGILPRLFFAPEKNEAIYRQICSILGGYVWDRSNPFTRLTADRLGSLESWL